MRVCFITRDAIGYDGWGRYAVEVIKGMVELGVEPVIVTASAEIDPALAGVEHHPILPPIFGRRLAVLRTLLHAPTLRPILKTCDLVHCITELYAPLVRLARPAGVKYVLTAHGTWAIRPLENLRRRWLFAPAFQKADQLIVVSHFTYGQMSHLIKLPSSAIVLTGGVHPEEFDQPASVPLPEWVAGQKIAIAVGAVKARKGQHVALEGVALAMGVLPDLHYVIVGDIASAPDYVNQLQARAKELQIADRVHFLGKIPFKGLVAWYQRADVFLLTPVNQGSSFEGLGLVYLEAGAAGTPSIGSLDCGAMEAIINGETGLLVPQNDPQAIAEALIDIFSDDDRRQRMGAAAREQARRLSWDNLVEQIKAQYDDLVDNK